MGSVGAQLRGPAAEVVVAEHLEEPIGDSGRAWEGDVINIPPSEQELLNEAISSNKVSIPRAARSVEIFENKTNFRNSDIVKMNELKNALEKAPSNSQIKNLIRRLDNLLEEFKK